MIGDAQGQDLFLCAEAVTLCDGEQKLNIYLFLRRKFHVGEQYRRSLTFRGKEKTCDNKKGHFVQAFAFHSTTLLDLELVFSLQNVTQNYPTVVIFRQTELNAYECMDGSM